MKNVIFFGFMADKSTLDQAFKAEAVPQVSAIKFQMSLLDGFAKNDVNVRILSVLPISSYPTNSVIWVRSKFFELPYTKVTGRLMFGINLPVINLLIRLITSVLFGIAEVCNLAKLDMIFVYSLHTPFLLAAICLKALFRVPVGVFIPDLPLNMSGKSDTGMRKIAKNIDNWLLQKLVGLVDITYPITEEIAKEWLPSGLKYFVVEGIAPSFNGNAQITHRSKGFERTSTISKRMLYTGSFTYLKKFVQWFSVCRDLNVNLVLVGGGPERFELENIARTDPRITIKEFMLGEQLDAEIEATDFLINPRDSEWIGSRFSFPSKLFDYMGRGKPVMSTRMAGIPEEYFDCFIEIKDDSLDTFKSSIEAALITSEYEIVTRIQAGMNLLNLTKSPKEVVRKIISSWSKC